MYRQVRRYVLYFLLENRFGSKAEMARQLDIELRTLERIFENLDSAKAGTVVFDKAIWYCAKSHISLDCILERYSREMDEEHKVDTPLGLQAQERLILKKPPALSPEGKDIFESMQRFLRQSSARICPRCNTWCNPWDSRHDATKLDCYIGHMAREIIKGVVEFYTTEGDDL